MPQTIQHPPSSPDAHGRGTTRSEFLAPWPLFAVVVMGVNDHVLKAQFHNAVTGKLSDFAICFFLPLFVSAAMGLFSQRAPRVRLVVAACIAATVFALLEMSDAVGNAFLEGLRVVAPLVGVQRVGFTRDPTDLLALVMVPLAVWYGARRIER